MGDERKSRQLFDKFSRMCDGSDTDDIVTVCVNMLAQVILITVDSVEEAAQEAEDVKGHIMMVISANAAVIAARLAMEKAEEGEHGPN